MNFTTGSTEALEGVLWTVRGPYVVLTDVSALTAGQHPKPMVGESYIHRSHIKFLQVLP